jgi:nitrilase
MSFETGIRKANADLVVLPEALLGGYPKGEIFGTRLGYRLQEGREMFAEYYAGAIDVPGPEVAELEELSHRTGASMVIGVIERGGSTLYCTALFITPDQGLVAKHRKLMPTGTERLIWGQGDGSTLPIVQTRAGRTATAICWENHMPQLRIAMYAKGIDIWAAPTVDDRDIWQCSMRHIAHEARCFVVSACQVQPSPAALGIEVPGWDADRPLIRGGSVIAGPLGDVLAGPLYGETGLVAATVDIDEIVKARYDFDVVGHYARPDVFSLTVDEQPRSAVSFK